MRERIAGRPPPKKSPPKISLHCHVSTHQVQSSETHPMPGGGSAETHWHHGEGRTHPGRLLARWRRGPSGRGSAQAPHAPPPASPRPVDSRSAQARQCAPHPLGAAGGGGCARPDDALEPRVCVQEGAACRRHEGAPARDYLVSILCPWKPPGRWGIGRSWEEGTGAARGVRSQGGAPPGGTKETVRLGHGGNAPGSSRPPPAPR